MNNRWPLHEAYIWERIPFIRLLLPLVLGIAFYSFIAPVFFIPFCIIALIAATTFITSSIAKQGEYSKAITFGSFHIALILAGWLLSYQYDIRNDAQWFGGFKSEQATVVEVTTKPVEKEHSWKLEVDVTHSVYMNKVHPATGKAFLYISKYDAPAYKEGDVLIVPDDWELVRNNGNPYEFDYAGYLHRNNIYHQQFAKAEEVLMYTYADEADLPFVRKVHYWCIAQLEEYIHDGNTLSLLKAMLAGETNELDRDMQDAYADTGIIHVISISGAHITMFFVFVSALLAWIRHRKYRGIKYIAALPLVWLYVLMAGAPPPAFRAALMFSILAVGFAWQKNPNGINQLLATAFILLCVNPMWLYAIGFQLSFVGVLSIFIFYKPIYKLWSPVNIVLRKLWSAVAVSIAAEILIAPIVIYYFHSFPVQFIIANVLAYMFMGIVLVLGMMILLFAGFAPVATFLGAVASWLTSVFNQMIFPLQKISPDSFKALTLTAPQMILVFIIIAGISIFLIKENKRGLFAALISTCLLLTSFCYTEWEALHQQKLIVYHTSKESHVELINSKTATQLVSPKESSPEIYRYVLTPAHINMHVEEIDSTNKANYLQLQGKKVFIIEQPITYTIMHADIVILAGKAKGMKPLDIKKVFTPELVVTTGVMQRKQAAQFEEDAKAISITVHNTYTSGAYILGDN